LTVTFLKSRHETDGALDAFEVTIPTTSHNVIAHFHHHYDETIFGIDGITTWTVDGVPTKLGPGEQLFGPRGSHHTYANFHPKTARILCLLTPGMLGPEYFQELAIAMEEDGPTESAAAGLVKSRYGVIPSNMIDFRLTPPTPSLTQKQDLRHTQRGVGLD